MSSKVLKSHNASISPLAGVMILNFGMVGDTSDIINHAKFHADLRQIFGAQHLKEPNQYFLNPAVLFLLQQDPDKTLGKTSHTFEFCGHLQCTKVQCTCPRNAKVHDNT